MDFSVVGFLGWFTQGRKLVGLVGGYINGWVKNVTLFVVGGEITQKCTSEILGMKYIKNMEREYLRQYLKQNKETKGP